MTAALKCPALLLFAFSAVAQDNDSARIGRLLEAMQVGQQMGANLDEMSRIQSDAMRKALIGQLGPDKSAIVDDLIKRVFARLREELAWPKLKPEFVKVYAQNFTSAEIEDMLKFYESPMGQTLVKKQFDLNRKSMQLGMDAVSDLVPAPPGPSPAPPPPARKP